MDRDAPNPGADDPRTRIVLLGTGTNVGKTWFGANLCRALRHLGAHCVAVKPVESGWTPGSSDAELLAAACGHAPPPSPYRFEPPISPHLAARLSGRVLTAELIRDHALDALRDMPCNAPCFGVIETAGGLFSPLAPGVTNWDVARALDPALWILIAPDSLGVLHDVTASLEAARARGRSPDLVALSAARPSDASTGTNAAELTRLGIVTPAATLTRGDGDLSRFAAHLLEVTRSAERSRSR
jgi:dethiobiotin synthetase